MSLQLRVYDFPLLVRAKQMFHAGGQALEGGFTAGGARKLSPEPGGRGVLKMEFTPQSNAPADTLVSWLCTMIANGNIFRIPIEWTPQVVSFAEIGYPDLINGVPWAATDLNPPGPWDTGLNWEADVLVLATSVSLAGTTTVTVNFASVPLALKHGQLIGHNDVTYLVEDIEYDGTVATITVNPPLRHSVAVSDYFTLRPKMLASARDPESFRGLYEPRDIIRLGSVEFVEALI